jgi:hypothetical protein
VITAAQQLITAAQQLITAAQQLIGPGRSCRQIPGEKPEPEAEILRKRVEDAALAHVGGNSFLNAALPGMVAGFRLPPASHRAKPAASALIKKNKKCSSYIRIQKGSGEKSYMTNDLLIYGKKITFFLIY